MRKFLNRLAAILTGSLNQRLLELREGFANQASAVNHRLDELRQGFNNQSTVIDLRLQEFREGLDNQSAAVNFRLDRLTQGVFSAPAEKLGSTTRASSAPVAVEDIDLIERYSHDWKAHAQSYWLAFHELREAARRLLPALQGPLSEARLLSDAVTTRLRHVEDEIACLVRQPLFFPEMFHGVHLQPDGTFKPLTADEFEHIRAGGLLGLEDRIVIERIYWRLSQNGSGPLKVVEIGTAAGRGSTRIAGEYVRRTGGTLYCIDPHTERSYLAFLANLRIFELESTVLPIRANSIEAAPLFDDGSLDAVFVDGSHIYPDVLADIDAYLPKIRSGGLILGHDLHDVPSRFDRDELLKVADKNTAEVSYTTPDGRTDRVTVHPGVILAVQDRFGDDIETFPDSVVWARQL
jgi:predicted O-methyltransferase YrrM